MFENLVIRTRPDPAASKSPAPVPRSLPLPTAAQKRTKRQKKKAKQQSSQDDAPRYHSDTDFELGKNCEATDENLEALRCALLEAGYLVRMRTIRRFPFDPSQLDETDSKDALVKHIAQRMGLAWSGVPLWRRDENGRPFVGPRIKQRTPAEQKERSRRIIRKREAKQERLRQAAETNRRQGRAYLGGPDIDMAMQLGSDQALAAPAISNKKRKGKKAASKNTKQQTYEQSQAPSLPDNPSWLNSATIAAAPGDVPAHVLPSRPAIFDQGYTGYLMLWVMEGENIG